MICFPNAKINFGLNIVEKRTDGFHNLETIFLPIGLKDALECVESNELRFENSGITIDGDPFENICVKAWHLLNAKYNIPPVHIHLHKVIPFGAGLGGGSADAAFMLKLLNEYFGLNILQDELMDFALKLGSDCPIFIKNVACYGTGRGEILEPVSLNLKGFYFILINPGIYIPTKEAFAHIKPKPTDYDLRKNIQKPVSEWQNYIFNDFEAGIFQNHPAIGAIKQTLYSNGAIYASMSGSGSSVYGIFNHKIESEKIFPDYFIWEEIF